MSRRQSGRLPMIFAAHVLIMSGLVLCFALPANAATYSNYESYSPSKRQIDAQISTTLRRCIATSGGVTDTMDECLATEYSRIYKRFMISYNDILKRISPKSAKDELVASHALWITRRKDAYKAEIERLGGGSAGSLAAFNRDLRELIRRYLWLQQYRH